MFTFPIIDCDFPLQFPTLYMGIFLNAQHKSPLFMHWTGVELSLPSVNVCLMESDIFGQTALCLNTCTNRITALVFNCSPGKLS